MSNINYVFPFFTLTSFTFNGLWINLYYENGCMQSIRGTVEEVEQIKKDIEDFWNEKYEEKIRPANERVFSITEIEELYNEIQKQIESQFPKYYVNISGRTDKPKVNFTLKTDEE